MNFHMAGVETKVFNLQPFKNISLLLVIFFLSSFSPSHNLFTMAMPGPFGNSNAGMNEQEQQTIKMMQAVMESCPAKVAMAGTAGKPPLF